LRIRNNTLKPGLKIGELEVFWLRGGRFALDGGAMFGVVPKSLWTKKYPSDEENAIPLIAFPLLVRTPEALILIESGIGNKLNEKQRKIFRVTEDWLVPDDLEALGIGREDIGYVILTHFDFDHAGGVLMQNGEHEIELTFPMAKHVIQKEEWEDVLDPNIRSINTYWPINNQLLRESAVLQTVEGTTEIVKGVTVIHAGGHTRGFQTVLLESGGESAIHLGDLLPTHAHFNPLWIMAYDNFPLDAIRQKKELERKYIGQGAWFTFYHDPFVLACRFDERGNIVDRYPAADSPSP
jgi:glyoxylase-like metal-dependent hydrolase (beta-lactamase superfamily II)